MILRSLPGSTDKPYTIYPDWRTGVSAYCDMVTGGWTVCDLMTYSLWPYSKLKSLAIQNLVGIILMIEISVLSKIEKVPRGIRGEKSTWQVRRIRSQQLEH